MPIVQRQLRSSYPNANPEIYGQSNKNDVIEDLSFSSIAGCIRQLSTLANYSNEVFGNVATLVETVAIRVENLSDRCRELHEEVDAIVTFPKDMKTNGSSSTDDNSNNNRDKYRISFIYGDEYKFARQYLQFPEVSKLMDSDTMPQQMKLRYQSQAVCKIPKLLELEQYKKNLAGGSSIDVIVHRYSNPEFFLHQWLIHQEERMKKLESEKQRHREERRMRKLRSMDSLQRKDSSNGLEMKHSVTWKDR